MLKGERPTGDKIESFTKVLRDHVTEQLGAIARPDDIRFADNLPKTRSGKIMRRLLRAIARNEDITQDLSTLENPAIIDQLRGSNAAAPVKTAGTKPPARSAPKKQPAGAVKVSKPAAKKAKASRSAPKKKSVAKTPAKKPARKPAKAVRGKVSVKRKVAPKKKAAARRKK